MTSVRRSSRRFLVGWIGLCLSVWATSAARGHEPNGRVELGDHSDAVYAIAFSTDEKAMASGSYDKTVKIWDLEKRSVTTTLSGHTDQVFRVAFSHNGKWVASASGDGTAILWDAGGGTKRQLLRENDEAVFDVAFSADDRRVATAGSRLRLWDWNDARQRWSVPCEQAYFSVAIAPNNRTVVCGTSDVIRWIDMEDGTTLQEQQVAKGMVYQLEFSRDGKRLVSASSDGTMTLWDAAGRRPIDQVAADASALFTATFSPDGKTVATGGRERVVRIWEVPSLRLLHELQGPRETVLAARFSPSGKRLAAGTYDGKIHIWPLDPRATP